MMIAVPEKYALEVSSPAPITSERQHQECLSVLDKLASMENPTRDEEKYAGVLTTLIEAYEEQHQSARCVEGWAARRRQLRLDFRLERH